MYRPLGLADPLGMVYSKRMGRWNELGLGDKETAGVRERVEIRVDVLDPFCFVGG